MSRTRLLLAILVALLSAGVPATGQPGDQNDITSSPTSTQSLGYGFGAQLEQPFHEVGSQALASLFFFNLSQQDAVGAGTPVGGEGCSFFMNILDDKGRLVRRPRGICPLRQGVVTRAPIRPFPLPAGSFRRLDVPLPLAYASSETGDPDGTPLPGGLYSLKATQLFNGPGPGSPLFMFGGGDPEARLPFRIFQCTTPAGSLPIRELVRGSFSGYGNNDPSFYGEDLVLRTGPAGLQFWERHTSWISPPPGPPAVDLSQEMVLVSLLGRRPDGWHSIQITSVEEKPCHLEVTVLETISPNGIDVVTNPFDIVAVPRSLKEIVFFHDVAVPPLRSESNTQCSGGVGSCP